ncbi:hypothetical protein BDZ45DRAFT_242718 [Acephala macrosclerotiorum]|nr:hypothetical protein BDZ45DRAFT_242718 [Acephala macrosclerotiorum]
MAVHNFFKLSLAALAILSAVSKANPIPQSDDGSSSSDVSTLYSFVPDDGTLIDLDSDDITWSETASEDRSCARSLGASCGCQMKQTTKVVTDSSGTWWTDWCRVDGLSTQAKGDEISIMQIQEKSTGATAQISLSTPMISALSARLGFDVAILKGWGKSYGCVNQDGIAHGLWLQENIGWAWQTITTDYYVISGNCNFRGDPHRVSKVQINFPDPRNTGAREFHSQCGWADQGGRTCDFNSNKHI